MPKFNTEVIASGGVQLPSLPSQAGLGTDVNGNVVAGSGGVAATPTHFAAGTVVTVAAGTQTLWADGITVGGSLIINGSLRGVR